MARVWLGPTTWTGLLEKLTVATPPETVAVTWTLVADRKDWSPADDSAAVGPSSRAPRIWLRVAGICTSRRTATTVWVGATRKIDSGTVTAEGRVEPVVSRFPGFNSWNGTSALLMVVGAPPVGIPHA